MFGKLGIGGRGDDVYTVHHKELAAVVSRTPLMVYDPTRENALAHEHVNEVVMIDNGITPVPMSFGTVFKTESDIVEFLKDTYDALRDVLQKMQGKLEFGLKITWNREEVLVELERSNEYVAEVYGHLRDTAIASRPMKTIGDKMIMNAAFLVERDRADEFDQKVQGIGHKHEGKLQFRYTGPWPPYNFVTIRLQLERSAVVYG